VHSLNGNIITSCRRLIYVEKSTPDFLCHRALTPFIPDKSELVTSGQTNEERKDEFVLMDVLVEAFIKTWYPVPNTFDSGLPDYPYRDRA
jgi:hypothetical protein